MSTASMWILWKTAKDNYSRRAFSVGHCSSSSISPTWLVFRPRLQVVQRAVVVCTVSIFIWSARVCNKVSCVTRYRKLAHYYCYAADGGSYGYIVDYNWGEHERGVSARKFWNSERLSFVAPLSIVYRFDNTREINLTFINQFVPDFLLFHFPKQLKNSSRQKSNKEWSI